MEKGMWKVEQTNLKYKSSITIDLFYFEWKLVLLLDMLASVAGSIILTTI